MFPHLKLYHNLKSLQENLLPLFSFVDFKYRKLSNQDLNVENHLLCTNDNGLTATNRESGVLNSHTDLRSPTTVSLLPEMRE